MGGNGSIFNGVCIGLSILLAGGLGTAMFMDRYNSRAASSSPRELTHYEQLMKDEEEARKKEEEERAALEAADSFYQKLADGFKTRVLVLGDTTAADWPEATADMLKAEYHATVKTTVLTDCNTAYAGYVNMMNDTSKYEYDAVVICIGAYDTGNSSMAVHYEALLRAIRQKNSKCSVICIAENSLHNKQSVVKNIKDLAKRYHAQFLDMPAAFEASKYAIADLTSDGIHPNTEGQGIYADALVELITGQVKAYAKYDSTEVRALNMKSLQFENYHYMPASEMTRKDDCTFVVSTNNMKGILGLDCTYDGSKSASVEIIADGRTVGMPYLRTGSGQSKHTVTIICDPLSKVKELQLRFNSKDSADLFHGLILSYEK